MRRGALALAAALVLVAATTWRGEGDLREAPEPASAQAARVGHGPVGASTGDASDRADRLAGFPSPSSGGERRDWRGVVWSRIGTVAGPLDQEDRRSLVDALARLRDAARARSRAEGASDAARAARRHREAALAADRVSRERVGLPLGVLLERSEPGGVEDVSDVAS